ncbi:hypothetical protein [Bacillus sp. JCM 19034]|uniref:hypothetical protein n=1 Tax=Bacillus sp. JCM 19034 TaxID=1481928 RepID=UPI000B010D55|nr:hypothetical protein [Bacillus sp. JCM 19034]
MKVRWIWLFIIILFMGACSQQVTVEEVFERGIEAQEAVDSMVLETSGQTDSFDLNWVAEMNMSEGIYSLQYDNALEIYKDKDTFIGSLDGEALDEYTVGFLINKVIAEYEQLLKRFDNYVEDVNEVFEIEVEDEHYIITYIGDEEQQQQLADQMSSEIITLVYEGVEMSEAEVENMEFVITIDKESNLVAEFEQKVRIKIHLEDDEELFTDHFYFDEDLTTSYSQFDSVGEIDMPVVSESSLGGIEELDEIEATPVTIDLSDEEIEEMQEEAANYVDALVQATVFQNADGFGDQVAGSHSVEEKQASGEMQRDMFVEFYRQNTKMNMGEYVSDELIDELTDAFMHAISQTSYEVIDSQIISDEQFVVTLSITGMLESTIMEDIENQLIEEIEQGTVDGDNWIEYQVELMIDAYNGEFVEGETTEATVSVLRDDTGSYHVLMQDEYLLGGFVQ